MPLRTSARGVTNALVAVALAGCGGSGNSGVAGKTPDSMSALPAAVSKAKDDNAVVDPAIVNADNAFGLSFLQTLQQQKPTDNITISPLSLSIAFQIVYNGAAGSTQTAMAQTLQLGSLTTQQMNDDNAALQATLINPDPQVQLTIANSLWMHLSSNPILPSFIATNQNYYGVEIGDLAGAPDNINAWVSQQTQGLIPTIAPPGDYGRVIAFVANAVYFKGQWTTPFDPNATGSESFTTSSGTTVPVRMMHRSDTLAYLQGPDFQMVRLPYGQGRVSMLILLPAAGQDLGAFVANITPSALSGWLTQMQEAYGDLALPKFHSASDIDLQPPLQKLGMGIAFDCLPDSVVHADFSNLVNTDSGVCIQQAEHKAWIQVDEMGTVAAAATGIGIGITAIRQTQFNIVMDRPFLYAIRDDDTGELLFIGTMLDPSE